MLVVLTPGVHVQSRSRPATACTALPPQAHEQHRPIPYHPHPKVPRRHKYVEGLPSCARPRPPPPLWKPLCPRQCTTSCSSSTTQHSLTFPRPMALRLGWFLASKPTRCTWFSAALAKHQICCRQRHTVYHSLRSSTRLCTVAVMPCSWKRIRPSRCPQQQL